MAGEVGFRIGELGTVCTALKVKIDGGARIADFLRERGLAEASSIASTSLCLIWRSITPTILAYNSNFTRINLLSVF
jgi:hypothetical protein